MHQLTAPPGRFQQGQGLRLILEESESQPSSGRQALCLQVLLSGHREMLMAQRGLRRQLCTARGFSAPFWPSFSSCPPRRQTGGILCGSPPRWSTQEAALRRFQGISQSPHIPWDLQACAVWAAPASGGCGNRAFWRSRGTPQGSAEELDFTLGTVGEAWWPRSGHTVLQEEASPHSALSAPCPPSPLCCSHTGPPGDRPK